MQLFEIHIHTQIYVISQIAGFVSICIYFIALQFKNKTKTLRLYALENIFAITCNLLLSNFVIVGTKGVSLFKNISFAWLQGNRQKFSKSFDVFVLVFFIALALVVGWFTWGGFWYNWVIVSALAFSYFGEWHKNIHILRLGGTIYICSVFFNAIIFANIADMLKCTVSLVANLAFYVRWFAEKISSNHAIMFAPHSLHYHFCGIVSKLKHDSTNTYTNDTQQNRLYTAVFMLSKKVADKIFCIFRLLGIFNLTQLTQVVFLVPNFV